MDMPLNVDVHCTDGLGGCSTRIIVDPAARVVTHLVVADNQAPHTEYLVPVSYIKATTPEVILIECNWAEVHRRGSPSAGDSDVRSDCGIQAEGL